MSNLSNGLNFRLSSLKEFSSRILVNDLLDVFDGAPAYLRPAKYGRVQPLKSMISAKNREKMISLMSEAAHGEPAKAIGVLLMEFAPGGEYLVHWMKRPTPTFAGISGAVPWTIIQAESGRFDILLSFIKKLVEVSDTVYGDIQNAQLPGWDTPLDLQKRLPDVPWCSIYGQPYIDLFGEEKILSAPFYRIEKLCSGHFWLQSTESIFAPVSDAVRAAIRRHFGEDSFMVSPRWRYKDGKAPQFRNNLPLARGSRKRV